METYTREQVYNILVSVILFAGANSNQGCKPIKGITYGDKADTILKVWDIIEGTDKSIISVVGLFRRGIE
jgi:hypothetical protein